MVILKYIHGKPYSTNQPNANKNRLKILEILSAGYVHPIKNDSSMYNTYALKILPQETKTLWFSKRILNVEIENVKIVVLTLQEIYS